MSNSDKQFCSKSALKGNKTMSVSHCISVSLNTTRTCVVAIIKRVSSSFASLIIAMMLSLNNHYLSAMKFITELFQYLDFFPVTLRSSRSNCLLPTNSFFIRLLGFFKSRAIFRSKTLTGHIRCESQLGKKMIQGQDCSTRKGLV